MIKIMQNLKNIFKNSTNSGFVMLFAVFLSVAILSLTMGVLNVSFKEVNFSSSGRGSIDASLAADLGVECALYNDKSTANKFPIPYAATTMNNCVGITPTLTGGSTGPNTVSYDFILPGIGATGKGCVKVNVSKDSSIPRTIIISKGYNIGNSFCNSSNPNRLEREYEVRIGGVLTPPTPPPVPGNKALFYSLTGSGSGTISTSPSGSSCGTNCLSFANGTAINLSANPAVSSVFTGWGGDCSGMSCVLTMDSDRSVTANFDATASPPPPPNITLDSISNSGALVTPGSPITWNHTIGSGSNSILVVTTAGRINSGNAEPTSVTFNNIALTKIRGDTSLPVSTSMWYLKSPPVGTFPISVTVAANHFQANGISLFGVNQTTPVNVQNGATGASAGPISVNLATTVANTYIIDVATRRTTNSEAITMTSLTNRLQRTNSLTAAGGIRTGVSTVGLATAINTYVMRWNSAALNGWAISAAAFRP